MSEDPPKPQTLSQLPWTAPWLSQMQAKLGTGFSLDPNGSLMIDPQVDQTGYNNAAGFLWQTRERSTMVVRATNRLLGELILNYSAKFSVTDAEAIDAMELASPERSVQLLRGFARIVKRLPSDVLALEGLTHSHFDTACKFQGPEEPDKQREWNLKIRDILFAAAECPEERTVKWVADSIRSMQKEFGITPNRPEGGKVLLDQYATINYILEHWTDEQFDESGQDRAKVLDYRDQIEGELINRNIMAIPDPVNFVPPWRLRTEPEEVIDVMDTGEQEVLPPLPDVQSDDELPILE